jgi:O-antigen/teichoic acid export membrane protein
MALMSGQLLTGAALLILARRSTVAEYGRFAALYAASLALGRLLEYGSTMNRMRVLAQGATPADLRSWLLTRTLYQAPVAIAFSVAALAVMDDLLPAPAIVALCLQSLTYNVSNGTEITVRVYQSVARAAWYVVAGNTLLLLSVTISPENDEMLWAAVAASSSWLVTSVLCTWSTRRLLAGTPLRVLRESPWRGAGGFGVYTAAVALQSADVAILAAAAGASASAHYAAVSKWVQPSHLLAHAVATSTFPNMAGAKSHRAATQVLRSGAPVMGAAVGFALLLAVFSSDLVKLLLGDRYESSAGLLRLLAIACIPSVACQPFISLLQARGLDHFAARALSAITIAMLGWIALTGQTLGELSVGTAWLGGYSVLAALVFYKWKHLVDTDSEHRSLTR